MKCDCIDRITVTLKNEKSIGSRNIASASIVQAAIMFSNGRMQTFTEFEISVVGQKKPVIKNVLHVYCPFCGVKIED